MKVLIVRRKFLWLFPYTYEVPMPRIRYSVNCWTCSNGNGQPGFGQTPVQAWNDWANWALI